MHRLLEKVFSTRQPGPSPERAGLRTDQLAEIEQFVESAIQQGKMAGAVLLIARNGELATHRALGWLDREERIPMRLDALFYVLSMTKAITCAALLSIVDEEGKVSLDDPIERWLPEFKGIGFVDGRKPKNVPLLWQCMAHSSGLLDSFPESFMKSTYTLPEFLSVGARNHLGYEPGEGWGYCNLGIAVAGRVIELALGKPYRQAVQERILSPLGMKDSFFQVPAGHVGRLAAIYRLKGDELLRDYAVPFQTMPDYVAPEKRFANNGTRFLAVL